MSEALALGQLPDDWATVPLFAVAGGSNRRNIGLLETNLLSLSYGRIVRKDITTSEGLLPESFEGYQIVEPGDTVLRLTDLQNDQRSLRTGYVTERGIITSAYVAVRPQKIDPRFFTYLLYAYDVNKAFYALGGGLRQGMNFADLKRLPIPLPPLDEQRRIADFLDDQTTRIDKAIQLRSESLSLLNERFDSLCEEVVTGADTRSPQFQKDNSPLAWLEQPPNEWTRLPLPALYTFHKGRDAQRLNATFVSEFPGPFPVYSGQTKSEGVFGSINTYEFDVPQGAILVSTVGAAAMTTRFISGRFSLSQNCAVLIPRPHASSNIKFVEFQLRPLFRHKRSEIPDHMQPSLRLSDLGGYSLSLPSMQIQGAIADELVAAEEVTNDAVALIEKSTALFQERKRSLITAAVTGEFDVSSASIRAAGVATSGVQG